jgi:phosphatidate cytidylyltransferase
MTTHFKQRLLVSSVGTLFVALAIYYSYHPYFRPFFVLMNAGVISLAVIEYYKLATHKGFFPQIRLGVASTIAYVIACYLSLSYPGYANALPALILLGTFILFFVPYFYKTDEPLVNMAVSVFGIAYLTIPLTFGIEINYFSADGILGDGRLWLAYILIVTKITDIGAYLCGNLMGHIKLAPMISPKKTVEGAVGGILAALIASLFFYYFLMQYHPLTLLQSILLGLAISVLSQFGDLVESILKRDAGVKDSSRLPGLGGILDIVDSLVFTLPLMYLLLKMRLLA